MCLFTYLGVYSHPPPLNTLYTQIFQCKYSKTPVPPLSDIPLEFLPGGCRMFLPVGLPKSRHRAVCLSSCVHPGATSGAGWSCTCLCLTRFSCWVGWKIAAIVP